MRPVSLRIISYVTFILNMISDISGLWLKMKIYSVQVLTRRLSKHVWSSSSSSKRKHVHN